VRKLIERKERSRQTELGNPPTPTPAPSQLQLQLQLLPVSDSDPDPVPCWGCADQTLCLLNLKRLPDPMGGKCEGERKTQKLFLLPLTFFTRSPWASYWLPLCSSAPLFGSLSLFGSLAAVCLLIQDNKCLSLGFRQLFTLS